MIDPSVSSAVCHSPVLPQRSDRHRIRGPRAAPNHVRVSDYAGRYYSPELNPVENVWEFLRANFLSHRIWPDYDAIVDACCTAWNSLMHMPEQIASIATRSWAQVKV